ncbi:MAG TPA: chromate efflux transporter [Thermoanaerobaculia bacterium]
MPTAALPPRRGTLGEVALLFLKLGTIAFGGPAAHIAMMEDEVVRRRRWLTREAFLDLLGAASLIPGPSSTELAIYIGHDQAGWPGLLAGGVCFILPAALLVAALAWAYVRFGALPAVVGVLYGIKPVVIAVVAQALWGMARTAVKTRVLALLGAAAVVATLLGADQLAVLVGAGVLSALVWRFAPRSGVSGALAVPALSAASAASAVPFGLWPLFGVFLKIGAVLFGSGYVLLAFLRADLVDRLHWLTERQLLDAVAVGQVTPGPVFTTATFIGYLLGRGPGAVVATVAIFLPGFLLVAVSGPLIPRLRRSALAGAALDGIVVASLGLMLVVALQLARAALVDPLTVGIAAISGVALLRFRVNASWLVVAAALLGWLSRFF